VGSYKQTGYNNRHCSIYCPDDETKGKYMTQIEFQSCDIVFFNPVPILSDVLKFFLRCPWSHTALATGNGIEVIGAEAEGIVKRQLTKKELEDFAILRYAFLTEKQKTEIITWGLNQEGVEYDFLQLLVGFPLLIDVHNEAKLTCSIYVYLAYKSAGIELVKRINPVLIDPLHLWVQSGLEFVAGRKIL
jgi:hypothetical protein